MTAIAAVAASAALCGGLATGHQQRDGAVPRHAARPTATEYAVQQVLATINEARAEPGLPPYTLLPGLTRAAAAHTQLMIGGCGLHHECTGEGTPQQRDAAQGVTDGGWENIAWCGPVPSRSDQDVAHAAVASTLTMLAEQPPHDGHRRNLLNATTRHIGISIQVDAQGRVWQTQDISR